MKNNYLKSLCFNVAIILSIFISNAQPAGSLDWSFARPRIANGDSSRFNAPLFAAAVQPDNKLLICGDFTLYNGINCNYFTRLDLNDNIDTSFHLGSGFDTRVSGVHVQPDNKIIVTGSFQLFNGDTCIGIVRLLTDGTRDTSFKCLPGVSGATNAIAMQTDGKILLGGVFQTCDGVAASRIARLNINGTIDTSFHTGTGFDNGVNSISIQTDGKIIVSGYFQSYNGTNARSIVRLNTDGVIDTSFLHNNLNNAVITTALQTDGKVLIGGSFTQNGTYHRNRLTRLNTNGSLDTTFITGHGFDNTVTNILIQPDGKILAGGSYTLFDSLPDAGIIRLNTDGTKDQSFFVGGGITPFVSQISFCPDGRIFIYGNIDYVNFTTRNDLARIDSGGFLNNSFNVLTGFDNTVNKVVVLPDDKILCGGSFHSFNGYQCSDIIKLSDNGEIDTSFFSRLTFGGEVQDICFDPSTNKYYISGNFSTQNGYITKHLARLFPNGVVDSTFNTSGGFTINDNVNSIAVQADGKLIAGGAFDAYKGVSNYKIVRLNGDGEIDTTFHTGAGFNADPVRDILIQPDGKILVGGHFTYYDITPSQKIARLNIDGTVDTTFKTLTGFDDDVNSIALDNNGKIMAVGSFFYYRGVYGKSIIRLEPNGDPDTTFHNFPGFNSGIADIEIQSDGSIISGGGFTDFNGTPIMNLARQFPDGTLDNTFDIGYGAGTGIVHSVQSIAFQSTNKLIVGGYFTAYDSTYIKNLCRVYTGLPLSVSYISKEDNILMYPNPCSKYLNIKLPDDNSGCVIRIIDLTGRVMEEHTSRGGIYVLNTKELSGLFLVQVVSAGHIYVGKIFIEN